MTTNTGVTGIVQMGDCQVDIFGCSMKKLVKLLSSPEANEIVDTKCNHCGKPLRCMRVIQNVVACDACREKNDHDNRMRKCADYWEHVCPEGFRNTDDKYPGFPAAAYRDALTKIKADDWKKSVFLFGPTGSGKTRVAFLILKQTLVQTGKSVGVLWPEEIAGLKTHFDSSKFDRFAKYEALLFDDSLLTACREPKLLDTIKQLVDVRMRHNRVNIFTSQIAADGVKQGKDFGKADSTDLERIEALFRRISDTSIVVNLGTAIPQQDERPF